MSSNWQVIKQYMLEAIGAAAGICAICLLIGTIVTTSWQVFWPTDRSPEFAVPHTSSWSDEITYYDFEAEDLQSAFDAMFAATPISINGTSHSAAVYPDYNWWIWPRSVAAGCAPHRFVVKGHHKIVMPNWTNWQDADRAAQIEWWRHWKTLLEHERTHIEITRDAIQALENEIMRLPAHNSCEALFETARNTAKPFYERLDAKQESFDAYTNHGLLDGAGLQVF